MTRYRCRAPCGARQAFGIGSSGYASPMTAKIILLNGVAVRAKAIAKALRRSPPPICEMALPTCCRRSQNHPGGFSFETTQEGGKPIVAISTGPVGEQTMRGSGMLIAAMARQGNNLIVDDVLWGGCTMPEYRALLSDFSLHIVGVLAPSMFLRRGKGSVVTG